MKSFLQWLLSPSRAIQQANSEIEYLRAENKRLNDLLVQAWESSRVVPVQSQHRQSIPKETDPPKTLAAMQIEYEKQALADYKAWQEDEQARIERTKAPIN
jgi:hypothetical protein